LGKKLEKIVEGYTRESGVRGLEAKIAQVIEMQRNQCHGRRIQ
jgi:ATP-dependent Lon protease